MAKEAGGELPTRIKNNGGSRFGSELLRVTSEMAQTPAAGRVEVSSVPVQGEKGDVVAEIAIALASHVIYDLLKAAAKRLMNHPEYDELIQLNINGKDTCLKDILNETP
jgi:hypothetical protein